LYYTQNRRNMKFNILIGIMVVYYNIFPIILECDGSRRGVGVFLIIFTLVQIFD
jgi:hypothetical protein